MKEAKGQKILNKDGEANVEAKAEKKFGNDRN